VDVLILDLYDDILNAWDELSSRNNLRPASGPINHCYYIKIYLESRNYLLHSPLDNLNLQYLLRNDHHDVDGLKSV